MNPAAESPVPAVAGESPRYHMPRPRRVPDPRLSALSLLDEAAHRLRAAQAGTLGIYYASTLPFVLALLYFWADMSRSPDAAERGTALALGLAVLFVAMKTGQTVFAARMRAGFSDRPAARWTAGRLVRTACVQAAWQPTGFFVLPVALVFPIGWAYAFYQNLTVCGDGQPSERPPVVRAWRHALARPGQNHRALGVLAALGLCAWLAWMVTMFTVPNGLKMVTGEENAFTRSSGLALLNSTFLAVSVALVYLAFDPLAKTFYALRCFYADAETTGEDLLGELNALPPVERAGSALPAARAALLAVLFTIVLPVPGRADAAPTPIPTRDTSVSPDAMNHAVREVLSQREFTWRNPRPPAAPEARDEQSGAFTRFLKRAGENIDRWFQILRRWLQRDQPSPASELPDGRGGPMFGGIGLQAALYGLLAGLAAAVSVLLFRGWQARRAARELTGKAAPAGLAAQPDLADETVLADQLPEDEWLTLARSLLARGEHRLAMRAFYLSALASLGERGLLGIARHKSNRDYQGELLRRARDRAGLQETFGRLVARFERVWYGSHRADDALLADFQHDRARLADALPPVGDVPLPVR